MTPEAGGETSRAYTALLLALLVLLGVLAGVGIAFLLSTLGIL